MQTIRITKEQFPYLLRQIEKPPEYLDCAGALPPGEEYRYLCVIGSREFSEYGAEVCRHLINGLKNYPIVIVSGMAIGIDSIAHVSALDAGMKTIAFPGSGLSKNVISPNRHIALANRIIETGNTLLSPFKKDQTGTIWTFPVRNQLMAGSSHATLIIEGREGSGTLLTANYALEFSREVLIVPGSIFSDLSYGPHKLYKEGAIPVTSSEEILEALKFELPEKPQKIEFNKKVNTGVNAGIIFDKDTISCKIPVDTYYSPENEYFYQTKYEVGSEEKDAEENATVSNPISQPNLSSKAFEGLFKEEMLVIKILQYAPCSGSDLVQKTSFNVSQLNIILSELELKGLIKQNGEFYSIRR
ncbi:MAG: DNA-protecting protein DprA [Candidatus Paceibacterota bacterium]